MLRSAPDARLLRGQGVAPAPAALTRARHRRHLVVVLDYGCRVFNISPSAAAALVSCMELFNMEQPARPPCPHSRAVLARPLPTRGALPPRRCGAFRAGGSAGPGCPFRALQFARASSANRAEIAAFCATTHDAPVHGGWGAADMHPTMHGSSAARATATEVPTTAAGRPQGTRLRMAALSRSPV